jgi:hypothetical protein
MKYYRTMQEAFGPHTNHELIPMDEDDGISNCATAVALAMAIAGTVVMVMILL